MFSRLERGLTITDHHEGVKVETKRFSDEAREKLEAEGYLIYSLTGQSIRTQKDAGRPFWSTWHNHYPDLEALTSRKSEVAIRPKQLFLPKSNGKTLDEQLIMVARMSADLSQQIRDTQAVIGEAPDYVELAFNHLDATGKRLFGKDYNYNYARTITATRVGSDVARVGYFDTGYGLHVHYWHPDHRAFDLWVVPLVVPA